MDVGEHQLRWSSGYDARFTRERSPVQSRDEVLFFFPVGDANWARAHEK